MTKTNFEEGTVFEPFHANALNNPKYRVNPKVDGDIPMPPRNGFRNPGCWFGGPSWLYPKLSDEQVFTPGSDLPLRQLGLCIDKASTFSGNVSTNNGWLVLYGAAPSSTAIIHGDLGTRNLRAETGLITLQIAFKLKDISGHDFRFTLDSPEMDSLVYGGEAVPVEGSLSTIDAPFDSVILHKSWQLTRASGDFNHIRVPIPRLVVDSIGSINQNLNLIDLHWGAYQAAYDPTELDRRFDYSDVEPIIPSLLSLLGLNMPVVPVSGVTRLCSNQSSQKAQGVYATYFFVPFPFQIDCTEVTVTANCCEIDLTGTGDLPTPLPTSCFGSFIKGVKKEGFWGMFTHGFSDGVPLAFEISWTAS